MGELKSWNSLGDDEPLIRILTFGPSGTRALARELSLRSDRFDRARIVGYLASSGDPDNAIDALRETIATAGPGTEDQRSMALRGIENLLGGDGTKDLEGALKIRSRFIRNSALISLVRVGTIDAWDSVFALLDKMLRNPIRDYELVPSELLAVCYLGKFVGNPPMRESVVSLLRKRWNKFPPRHQEALKFLWPGIEPSGPGWLELGSPESSRLMMSTFVQSYINDGVLSFNPTIHPRAAGT
jgi:hypothetical protein